MGKFIISEIQTNADGSVGILNYTENEQNNAESVYYQKMAAAAISKVPIHTVVLMKNNGAVLMSGYYDHTEE